MNWSIASGFVGVLLSHTNQRAELCSAPIRCPERSSGPDLGPGAYDTQLWSRLRVLFGLCCFFPCGFFSFPEPDSFLSQSFGLSINIALFEGCGLSGVNLRVVKNHHLKDVCFVLGERPSVQAISLPIITSSGRQHQTSVGSAPGALSVWRIRR